MDIDAVIAEATQVAPAQEATTVAPIDETPKQEAEVTNDTVETVDDAVKPDSELTPEQLVKREANRQSHQNSREAKLRREVRELREFRAQSRLNQHKSPIIPTECHRSLKRKTTTLSWIFSKLKMIILKSLVTGR